MIGILPAAGNATRIHGLPKFLLPISNSYLLLRHVAMLTLYVSDVLISTTDDKAMLLHKYSSGARVYNRYSLDTMSESVLSLREYTIDESVLFGMPDTYIEDDQCYAKLAAALAGCDVAVAVFKTERKQRTKLGMVHFMPITNAVKYVVDKPDKDHYATNLIHAWGALAWKPAFWQYLTPDMPHVGYALMPAIEAGLDVRAVVMQGGYWDCGTFDEYAELIRTIT